MAESFPFYHVEIELTSNCDCRCFACDRFMDVGQESPLSLGQIKRFLRESVELAWPWERFHILGGEPTLHPQFMEVIQLLVDYRKQYHPDMMLRVISNGLGKLAKYRAQLIDLGILVNVEAKSRQDQPAWFRNIRLAPVDETPKLESYPPCSIFGSRACGLGFTPYGWFLCGAGAGVARIAGLDIGVQSLKDVTWDIMLAQAEEICRICGHWNSGERPHNLVTVSGEVNSPTWDRIIQQYNAQRPQLTLYGED